MATQSIIHDLFGEDSDDAANDLDFQSSPTTDHTENMVEGATHNEARAQATSEDASENGALAQETQGSGDASKNGAHAQSAEIDPNTVEDDQYKIEIDMFFYSIVSLFDAYQLHARSKSFSVIKKTMESQKYARIVCDKAGTSKANKTSKKVDCKARQNAIKQLDGSWLVSSMEKEDNHEIDPAFSPLMPANRQVNDVHMRRQLEANNIVGIRPCKNVRLCEVQSGGPQNLGCLPKDCTNYIEARRREIMQCAMDSSKK
ncbi:hypothetical protein ACS0TY_021638 [Phlomoides rotata]